MIPNSDIRGVGSFSTVRKCLKNSLSVPFQVGTEPEHVDQCCIYRVTSITCGVDLWVYFGQFRFGNVCPVYHFELNQRVSSTHGGRMDSFKNLSPGSLTNCFLKMMFPCSWVSFSLRFPFSLRAVSHSLRS